MISYYFEDTDFIFKGKTRNNKWLKLVAESEIRRIGDISIIFCSDNYILDVNQQYLQHDYFTDIITFDYCEGDRLSGDLFISVDSVRENAIEYGTEFSEIIVPGNQKIHICTGCMDCDLDGKCDFIDDMENNIKEIKNDNLIMFITNFKPLILKKLKAFLYVKLMIN